MSIEVALMEGVRIAPIKVWDDARGWLLEMFRADEVDVADRPAMGYISMTHPGVTRGPHEHCEQTDLFVFPGPGLFRVWMWDNRPESATFGERLVVDAGDGNPVRMTIPPGIVHAYRNIGDRDGLVINLPNRLYRGTQRAEAVDEIRHEDDPDSPFICE